MKAKVEFPVEVTRFEINHTECFDPSDKWFVWVQEVSHVCTKIYLESRTPEDEFNLDSPRKSVHIMCTVTVDKYGNKHSKMFEFNDMTLISEVDMDRFDAFLEFVKKESYQEIT